jgi:hypothetical protein
LGANDFVQLFANNQQIWARGNEIFRHGTVGPARVIRYQNVAREQQIRFSGIQKVQAIPRADLTTFTRGASMNARQAMNINSSAWLAELYNGDTLFRRCWTRPEWMEVLKNLPAMNLVDLAEMVRSLPKARQAQLAAGGLGDFLGTLGGLAGNYLVPGLGGVVGSLGGEAIGNLVGDQIAGTKVGHAIDSIGSSVGHEITSTLPNNLPGVAKIAGMELCAMGGYGGGRSGYIRGRP